MINLFYRNPFSLQKKISHFLSCGVSWCCWINWHSFYLRSHGKEYRYICSWPEPSSACTALGQQVFAFINSCWLSPALSWWQFIILHVDLQTVLDCTASLPLWTCRPYLTVLQVYYCGLADRTGLCKSTTCGLADRTGLYCKSTTVDLQIVLDCTSYITTYIDCTASLLL